MRFTINVLILSVACGLFLSAELCSAEETEAKKPKPFVLNPIGVVKAGEKGPVSLVINKDIAPALKGLDGYSHVLVFYWFDRNDNAKKRAVLQVYPRGDKKNPVTGVFACRCPMRPNLIAMSLCKIVSINENTVVVDGIDAYDKTPILDLKPYLPGYDSVEGATVPDWVKRMRSKK